MSKIDLSENKLGFILIFHLLFFIGPGLLFLGNNFYYPGIYELKKYTNQELNLNTFIGIYFLSSFSVGYITILRYKNAFNQNYNYQHSNILKLLIYFNIFIFMIGTFILTVSTYHLHSSEQFKIDLNNSVAHYYENKVYPLDVNILQDNLSCCGFYSENDYLKLENDANILPPSCCPRNYNDMESPKCTSKQSYKIGCFNQYKMRFNSFKKYVLILIGISLFLQLMIIILLIYSLNNTVYEKVIDIDKLNDKPIILDNYC